MKLKSLLLPFSVGKVADPDTLEAQQLLLFIGMEGWVVNPVSVGDLSGFKIEGLVYDKKPSICFRGLPTSDFDAASPFKIIQTYGATLHPSNVTFVRPKDVQQRLTAITLSNLAFDTVERIARRRQPYASSEQGHAAISKLRAFLQVHFPQTLRAAGTPPLF